MVNNLSVIYVTCWRWQLDVIVVDVDNFSTGDPFSEDGCLWSFNYFFYNQKIRRVLFFSARAMSTRSAFDSGMGTDEDDEDDCMFYEE